MRIRIFFILAMLLTSVTTLAQNYNITNLTVDEVKKQLDQPEKVLLVDTRTEEEYRQAHIRTAINIPPEQFTSIGKYLPKDKSLPIIFYCRGYSWGLSLLAVVAAQAEGYTHVYTFRGGFPEWASRGYPIEGPWENKWKELNRDNNSESISAHWKRPLSDDLGGALFVQKYGGYVDSLGSIPECRLIAVTVNQKLTNILVC